MDRYFTLVSVAKWVLNEQSITIVGTMRQDKKENPKESKMLDGREGKSTIHVYLGEGSIMLLVSVRKRVGKKHSATDNDAWSCSSGERWTM